MNKLHIYIILLLCIVFLRKIQTYPIDAQNYNPQDNFDNIEVLPNEVSTIQNENPITNTNVNGDFSSNSNGYQGTNDFTGTSGYQGANGYQDLNNSRKDENDTVTHNNGISNSNDSLNENQSEFNKIDNQNNKNQDNSNTESSEKNSNSKKKDSEKNYSGYLIFLSIVIVLIILLTVAIIVYKRKYLIPSKEVRDALDNEIKPGSFMEKMKIINLENQNNSPLLNFNMTNVISTNFSNTNSLDRSEQINNGYGFNKENEDYRKFDSMNRGLKPPPARDNNNKKKNVIKVKSNSPLVITTKRKSKNNDLSNTQISNSSINRTSTEMSLANRISHCSSNGGFGYINNKLNKHSSVAMTFGCHAVEEDNSGFESPNGISPTRTSMQTNNPSSSSRVSRISSQKSLTSFITNSPITQSFKNRISSYISSGRRNTHDSKKDNDSERISYNTESSSSRFTFYSNKNKNYISGSDFGDLSNASKINHTGLSSKKSINIDTSIVHNETRSSEPITSPLNTGKTNESSEQLINNQDYFETFLKDGDKSLDLSLNPGK